MTQTAQGKKTLMFDLTRPDERGAFAMPAWLSSIRKSALGRFEQTGFPTTKQEEWRFTSFASIAKTQFAVADKQIPRNAAEAVSRSSFGPDAAAEIVFINGHFAPELSRLGKLAGGVTVTNLADALAKRAG